ncbi:hypothetical protein BDV95DRAFT_615960, partial [Massariosphaeria phaeospora]
MTDPFSVAGSAVGVVSLGLLVCNSLISYTNNAKDAKRKASQISTQLDDLLNLLDQLQTVTQKIGPSQHASSTTSVITASSTAIQAVRKVLGKLGDEPQERIGIRNQVSSIKRRLSYPFKQEEILYWKGVLESIQQNLHTALLSWGLDQHRQDFESIRLKIDEATKLNQLVCQAIASQQEIQYDEISLRQLDQTRLIHHGHDVSDKNFLAVRQGVSRVHDLVTPVAANLSRISVELAALPQIALAMSRLESNLGLQTLESVSPDSLSSDYANCQTMLRRVKKLKRKRTQLLTSCSCRGQTQTIVSLRWPINLLGTRKSVQHDMHCPYATYGHEITELSLRVSAYITAFQRKVQVAFALSTIVGMTRVTHSLVHYRVVPYTSPAFRFIASLNEVHWPPSPDRVVNTIEQLMDVLPRLFQSRQASPYDRLSNGQSLLHYFCSRVRILHTCPHDKSLYNSIGMQLLHCVGNLALEQDDRGRTCNDYIFFDFGSSHLCGEFNRIGMPVVSSLRDLSKSNYDTRVPWGSHPYNDPDVFVNDSECMKMVMVKSETGLRELLDQANILDSIDGSEGRALYSLASLIGWAKGCQLLWSYSVPLVGGTSQHSRDSDIEDQTFFSKVACCTSIDTLQFWLHLRRSLSAEELTYLGALEVLLDGVNRHRAFDETSLKFLDITLAAIVQQRKALQQLAELHLRPHEHQFQSEGVLDAQAGTVLENLVDKGIDV